MKKFRVIENYKSPYPDPIVFQAGETVKVGQKFEDDSEWENWYWCEGERQQKAWVPKLYLNMDGAVGIFLQDYDAKEVTLHTDEVLIAYEEVNGFCMVEKENGEKGWAPLKYLELIE